MITAILYQVLQLYRLCRFAHETTVLKGIYPNIDPREYFADRLADTLDAIKENGIGNLELLITRKMIEDFTIVSDICHNDTTSASVYGNYKDSDYLEQGIKITYGYSKKHRAELKQLVWSLSVSSDHAFPLFQKAYNGNTADVDTYVEQWHNLIDLLDNNDFLYVVDSKIITNDNMVHIHENEGYFLGPAPMYKNDRNLLFYYPIVIAQNLEKYKYFFIFKG